MRLVSFVILCTVSPWLVAACGDAAPRSTGASIAIAPLSLVGVDNACYDLRITNDLEQVVWSAGTAAVEGDAPAICSNAYGNGPGGDISYVAPCDASEQDDGDDGVALNTATVWVDGLYDGSGADLGDYQNPCPWPTGARSPSSARRTPTWRSTST